MSHIDDLREIIHKLHGGHATHVESVPVKELFRGETVWDGIVEVFHLKGHPKTDKVYAWLHDTGEPGADPQSVTVLHIHPSLSPLGAVRTFLVKEFRDAQPNEA
jgi:hypothetical protein